MEMEAKLIYESPTATVLEFATTKVMAGTPPSRTVDYDYVGLDEEE